MQKRTMKNIILLSSIVIYFILFIFVIRTHLLKYSEVITASFSFVLLFISYLFYGFPKDKKNLLKQKIFEITLINIILYFLIIYGIGLFMGFLKNGYSLNINSIINNIISPLIIILCSELIRFIFTLVNNDKKIHLILLSILLSLLEYTLVLNVLKFYSIMDSFKSISLYIIPILTKHMTLTYLTYNAGYKPSLTYRLIFDLSIYILPFMPNLGDYLTIIANVSLPFCIYITTSNAINYYNNTIQKEYLTKKNNIPSIISMTLLVIFALLVSGITPIKLTGIASGSMSPLYDKGDCVISISTKESKLKKGDVIVFNKHGKKIIHRIDKIIETENGTRYQTKGDANKTADLGTIGFDEIDGVVKIYIPYLAYPAIYLNELLNK